MGKENRKESDKILYVQ